MAHPRFSFIVVVLVLYLSACKSSVNDSGEVIKRVSGAVGAGSIKSGRISIYGINGGLVDDLALAEGISNEQGQYSITLPDNTQGPLAVKVASESMTKMLCISANGCGERVAFGEEIFSSPYLKMMAFVPATIAMDNNEAIANITPLTLIAAEHAISSGDLSSASISASQDQVAAVFGILGTDILTQAPLDVTKLDEIESVSKKQLHYALMNAAIASIIMDEKFETYVEKLSGTFDMLTSHLRENGGALYLSSNGEDLSSEQITLSEIFEQSTAVIAHIINNHSLSYKVSLATQDLRSLINANKMIANFNQGGMSAKSGNVANAMSNLAAAKSVSDDFKQIAKLIFLPDEDANKRAALTSVNENFDDFVAFSDLSILNDISGIFVHILMSALSRQSEFSESIYVNGVNYEVNIEGMSLMGASPFDLSTDKAVYLGSGTITSDNGVEIHVGRGSIVKLTFPQKIRLIGTALLQRFNAKELSVKFVNGSIRLPLEGHNRFNFFEGDFVTRFIPVDPINACGAEQNKGGFALESSELEGAFSLLDQGNSIERIIAKLIISVEDPSCKTLDMEHYNGSFYVEMRSELKHVGIENFFIVGDGRIANGKLNQVSPTLGLGSDEVQLALFITDDDNHKALNIVNGKGATILFDLVSGEEDTLKISSSSTLGGVWVGGKQYARISYDGGIYRNTFVDGTSTSLP